MYCIFCDYFFINQEVDRSTNNKMLSEQEAPLREMEKEATSNM